MSVVVIAPILHKRKGSTSHTQSYKGRSFWTQERTGVTPAARSLAPGRRARPPPPLSCWGRADHSGSRSGFKESSLLRLRSARDPRPKSASRSPPQTHRLTSPDSIWNDRETPRPPQLSRVWDPRSEVTAVVVVTRRPAGSRERKTRSPSSG